MEVPKQVVADVCVLSVIQESVITISWGITPARKDVVVVACLAKKVESIFRDCSVSETMVTDCKGIRTYLEVFVHQRILNLFLRGSCQQGKAVIEGDSVSSKTEIKLEDYRTNSLMDNVSEGSVQSSADTIGTDVSLGTGAATRQHKVSGLAMVEVQNASRVAYKTHSVWDLELESIVLFVVIVQVIRPFIQVSEHCIEKI